MGAHRNEVTALLFDPLDDLSYWVAISQLSIGRNTARLEFATNVFEIRGILSNFGRDCVRTICSSGPTVGHVKQYNPALRQFGQFLYVFDDGAIGGRAIQSNKNRFIHLSP